MIALPLLFAYLIIHTSQQSISYSFTAKKQSLQNDFLHLSLIATEDFCIGTPYQCLTVQFDPSSTLIAILNTSISSNTSKTSFDKSLSSTVSVFSSHTYSYQKLITCNRSSDKIKFGSFELNQAYFYLASSWNRDLRYSTIGISSFQDDYDHPNFIAKLKSHQYILEFEDEDKGTISFNRNITDTTSNKRYIEQFRVPINQREKHTFSVFSIQQLSIVGSDLNLKVREFISECMFDETSRFIQIPFELIESIYRHYLNEANCQSQNYVTEKLGEDDAFYIYYLCAKSHVSQQQKLNYQLTFTLMNGNLTVNKEDLFQEFDDENVIFSIVFRRDKVLPKWVIGQPILKHYVLDRDFDASVITLYKKIQFNDSKIIERLFIIVICVIVLGFWFIGVSLFKIKQK